MASLQSAKLRSSQSYPSFDYYDYDYASYPAMQNSQTQRMGQQQAFNPRLARLGGNNLYGGYSNSYGSYTGAGAGSYGDYGDYSSYSGQSQTPAQAKSTYGSYSGGYNDCPGIPIALLLVTLLGIAVMGFILFQKINGAGRRKREAPGEGESVLALLLPELETLDVIILHGRGV